MKKKLDKHQRQCIAIVLAYHRCCEVLWNKAKEEAAQAACDMIEDIILNNEPTKQPKASERGLRHRRQSMENKRKDAKARA